MALIAAYAFDEGAGTTAAEIGGGTAITGIPAWAAGRHSTAMSLSLVNGPTVSPYATSTVFSMMFDAYIMDDGGTGYNIFLSNTAGVGNVQCDSSGNFSWYHDTADPGTLGVIPDLTWTNVAVVATGTQRKAYLNGTLVGTWANTSLSTSGAVKIGGDLSGGYTANFRLDNLRFFDTALTDAEVLALAGTAVTSGAGPAFNAAVFDAGSFYTPAATGTDNPVSGTVAASSTSSGSLAARLAIVGAVAATSAVVGAVSAQHPLGGTVAATSTATGSPVADHPVAGASAATTAVSGSPSSTQALAGTAVGTSATTGTIGLRTPLSGTTAATSTTTGAPSSRQALTGTTAATSTTAGTFFEAGPQNYPLTGAVAATTSTTGAVTAHHPLGGTVVAVSSAAGAVVRAAALAGAVESTAVTFGDVTASLILSGTVDAVSATAGEFVPPVTQFQGHILSVSLSIPTAAGSIAVPSATGDLVTHRVSARLSILRARGVIT